MNKFKHKLPRDELKKFAKELGKKLVESDFKHKRVGDPTKVNEKTERGVKKYAKDYFDKCVVRHREHEKKKADRRASKEAKAKVNGDSGSYTPPGEPMAATEEADTIEDDDEDIKLELNEDIMDDVNDDEEDNTPTDLKRKRESVALHDDVLVKGEDDGDSPSSPKKLRSEDPQQAPPPPPPPPPPPVPEGMELDDASPLVDDAEMDRSAMEDSFVAEAVEAVNGAAIGLNSHPAAKLENGDAINGQLSPRQLATPSTTGPYPYDGGEKKADGVNGAVAAKVEAVAGGQ